MLCVSVLSRRCLGDIRALEALQPATAAVRSAEALAGSHCDCGSGPAERTVDRGSKSVAVATTTSADGRTLTAALKVATTAVQTTKCDH